MTKSLIYYYKEEESNMPILTGKASDFDGVVCKEEIWEVVE
ncbi:hypothetical protein ACFMB7_28700 [Bacillus toyonensis]